MSLDAATMENTRDLPQCHSALATRSFLCTYFLTCLNITFFGDRVLLYRLDWPRTPFVDQAVPEFTETHIPLPHKC